MPRVYANLYNHPSGLAIAYLENTLAIQNIPIDGAVPVCIHSNTGDLCGAMQKKQAVWGGIDQGQVILNIHIDFQGVLLQGAIELNESGVHIINDAPMLALDSPGL